MPGMASAREMTKSGLVKSQFQANKRTLRPKVYPRKRNVEVADPKANKLSTDTSSDLKVCGIPYEQQYSCGVG
ncbi:hypothetical protein DVH24_028827 [Malus domestica]|uniref:Uncharacterized protein n=1 Tax=Malus domestica TaxID=3750 RepID=A0A498IYB5_MALDO|nr:hypothetical protein DVH24_028827 [Malus domestica]